MGTSPEEDNVMYGVYTEIGYLTSQSVCVIAACLADRFRISGRRWIIRGTLCCPSAFEIEKVLRVFMREVPY